jgi:hypothetical protein
MAVGYTPKVISTEAVNNAISSYAYVADAFAFQYEDRGHYFYVIIFPTAKKAWAYDSLTQLWHERASFNAQKEFDRPVINCSLRYKQYDLVGDYKNGNVYLMNNRYFDEAGVPIHRIRTTAHQNLEFKLVGVTSLRLKVATGHALSTGTGSDPQIMMRYSNDGGYTWSSELPRSIGKIGEYGKQVCWNRIGTSREWLFEFNISDPIDFAILDASVEIEVEE